MNQPIDLSRLGGGASAQGGPNGGASTSSAVGDTVSAWLAQVDEAGVRTYLELSRKLPVLLLVGKAGDSTISNFAKSLELAIEGAAGRVAGCEIDADSNPSLAQALRVTALPALFLLLDGKPSPIADSVVPAHELAALVQQVVALASQEGFVGKVRLADADVQAKPTDPRFDAAAKLLSDGNLDDSARLFQEILKDRPADREAKAGLGQVLLLQRLAQPGKLSEQERELLPADQLFAAGDFSAALELLLSAFASAPIDARQQIRERLVEFFGMIGDSEPLVIAARSRLASMLF